MHNANSFLSHLRCQRIELSGHSEESNAMATPWRRHVAIATQ